ncbi:MAG: serpin family protein [Dehalococcoidales bacterium]|nr:serpin family protein [Dehalococcoidales bacterium]
MKRVILVVLAVVIALSLYGCSQPAAGQIPQSDKPRDTAPVVDKAELDKLVEGNNAFAWDLYQGLRANGGNLFYSPYSISEALAMTYAGARGMTAQGMSNALKYLLAQERLHPAFNSLDLQFKQRGQGAKGKDGEGFRLNVVNAIWGQRDYKFLDQYLDVLAQNYGAGLRLLDFVKNPEDSRVTINNWVSDQTEQKIKDLIPQGAINTLTRLVLTNAIYFNAAWQHPFNEDATADGLFNLLNGSTVTVPLMKQTQSFSYFETDGYQAVELPYDGRELSMVILLPRAGQFDAFEQSLSGAEVNEITGKLERRQVVLTMPKFEYESSFGLKKALSDLGMGEAFTEQADFSGMNGKRDLLIQDVIHKAYIGVDEEGTEAAAATAVIVGTTSMPLQPVEVKIDRPFIYFIRDIATGSTVFVGRVLNPAAK